jgi:hypothetical protein
MTTKNLTLTKPFHLRRRILWHHSTSRKVAGSIPDEFIGFSADLILPTALWPLGSTQLLTEMSTRNRPGAKVRPERKVDNLTTIGETIVLKMWEPRRPTALWASTAGRALLF